ncbi:MAG TPA: thiamine pyrophosphate-dependent enzyme [Ferruginibacter sp.]|nr:thiamine pyrophosphate-dependent enzyme [Ferruginibacter sp.]HMP19924.1 thiamine pyrophosphate-dependent enzyme [Ferruginibacter sp.]
MDAVANQDAVLQGKLSFENFRNEVLNDYRLACISRETSLLGRKEVLTGKAKFGIFGDGKEVVQVAVAKFFRQGDVRAGYYRDQTLMLATGIATVEQYFSQLFADPDINNDPFSAGRQMNAHFATPNVDEAGEWLPWTEQKNSTSDMAPTASQMPRSLGLALASKLFREEKAYQAHMPALSKNGNEICFATIGDASTSEGHFWEVVNAAGVMQIPLAIFVWDDGYGISVPKDVQTTKASISEALKGLQKKEGTNGIDIYRLKGWDYAGMCEVLEPAIQKIRDTHTPAVFHIEELTQPQGHSTSGSHERYKTTERLAWEKEWDCIRQMRKWILTNELSAEEELSDIELAAKHHVKDSKQRAWDKFTQPLRLQLKQAQALLANILPQLDAAEQAGIKQLQNNLTAIKEPLRRDILKALAQALDIVSHHPTSGDLKAFYHSLRKANAALYNNYLYNEGPKAALNVKGTELQYAPNALLINGYEIINRYFDALFAANNKVVAFGEDLGFIGDVNQGFAGLQAKYGSNRIFDTGIRELSIVGQGIGLALRGLRPIAEIQYLDYLLYGLQTLSDDLATIHFRTAGKQSCPMIIRSRGHRLEGIWHSGSPMGMIINALRGVYVCVPRNMVQAAGMYNTILQSNDPALIIECLNGYRLKEKLPSNLLDYRVELGVPEIIRYGSDITIVSYGSTLRIVSEAAAYLEKMGISCEVVDVQTLLPFDKYHIIAASLKKTSRILFVDEDVPGGAAAYMFNKVMEEQKGYQLLDAAPRTLTAQAHRPSYGSDGDYFSKPNMEDVVAAVKEIVAE